MKPISKGNLKRLIKEHIIVSTPKGYKTPTGNEVGSSKTRNKTYIEDKYSDMYK